MHLSGHAEVYGQAQGDVTGEKVNKNLLFDPRLQHLYVTTEKKVRLLVLPNPLLSPRPRSRGVIGGAGLDETLIYSLCRLIGSFIRSLWSHQCIRLH